MAGIGWVICIAAVTMLLRIGLSITTPFLLDTVFGGSESNDTSTTLAYNYQPVIFHGSGISKRDAFMATILESSYSSGEDSTNISTSNGTIHTISPYFVVTGQILTTTIFCGVCLLITLVFFPGTVTANDRQSPKAQMIIPGCANGLSTILVIYAMSGTRTPPYLQAIVTNFNIPVQFIIRFVILRKRPTLFKLCCAIAVLGAEFLCLIPSIFPGLESSKQKHSEGGATGAGRVLFPMLMILSMIPFAIGNSVMERGVQNPLTKDMAGRRSESHLQEHARGAFSPCTERINLFYYLFWWSIASSVTLVSFFWTDIVPGYGTSSNIQVFANKMKFDWLCAMGQAGCGIGTVTLLWANFLFLAICTIAFAAFIRHSEGANFVVITMSLRTPILFIFWTLFTEKPFAWAPHFALSTWLSIAGLIIMVPAVSLYNIGAPEIVHTKKSDDQNALLANEDNDSNENQYINRDTQGEFIN